MTIGTQGGDADYFRQAQAGRKQTESAIVALLEANPTGLTNAEIARRLGLQTGLRTGQKNFLTWSILKELESQAQIGALSKPRGSGVLFVPLSSNGVADL